MKRPKLISAVCILGFISIAISFLCVFAPWTKKMGEFVPVIYGLIVAAGFMSYVGLWYMKKWGLELFIAVFFVKTTFFIVLNDLGAGTVFSIVSSLIYLIPIGIYYREMDVNL